MPSSRALAAATGRTDVPNRLMDAAERLVALHGDAGASSRAITLAAGQRHNSAIAYHFGSRVKLLEAVWDRGSREVNDWRREMLATRHDGPFRIPDLVEIYLIPFARHLDASTPSYWARFNEEALHGYPLDILPMLRNLLGRHGPDIPMFTLLGVLETLADLTLDGHQPAANLRVSGVVRFVISTLAAWERDAETGTADSSAVELGHDLVPVVIAMLATAG